MPLIVMVTLIIIPLLILTFALFSMILFGYEFNFFHLISFRKNNNHNNSNTTSHVEVIKTIENTKKEELFKILDKLNKEKDKLNSQNNLQISNYGDSSARLQEVDSNELKLVSIKDEDLNEKTIIQNIDNLLEKVHTKEEEFKAQIDKLKAENEKLKNSILLVSSK